MRIYNIDIEIDVEDISIDSFIDEKGHEEVADFLRDGYDYAVFTPDSEFKNIDDMTPIEIWNYIVKEHGKWLERDGNIVKEAVGTNYPDEDMMWLELCNNYPTFLAEKIGQLVLGDKNGNS